MLGVMGWDKYILCVREDVNLWDPDGRWSRWSPGIHTLIEHPPIQYQDSSLREASHHVIALQRISGDEGLRLANNPMNKGLLWWWSSG